MCVHLLVSMPQFAPLNVCFTAAAHVRRFAWAAALLQDPSGIYVSHIDVGVSYHVCCLQYQQIPALSRELACIIRIHAKPPCKRKAKASTIPKEESIKYLFCGGRTF